MATIKKIQIRNTIALLKKNTRELKRSEKKYHKIYKKLMIQKYTSEYVHKLEKKYLEGKNPKEKKFNNLMTDLSKQFFEDLHEFIKWYNTIFTIFDQIAFQDDKNEYQDLKHIDEILTATYGKKVYYGDETLHRFNNYMKHFIHKIQIEAKRAVLDSKRVAHGGTPRFALFKRLRGETALARHIAHIVKRKLPKAQYKSDNIRDILLDEIKSNNIKQDFLALFESLLTIDERNIINSKIIKKDIATLISKHLNDAQIIMSHIKNFSAIAVKYVRISSEMEQDSKIFKETGKYAKLYVKNEFKNEGILYRFGEHAYSDANILLSNLEEAKREVDKHKGVYFEQAA